MTLTERTTIRALIERSDDHPALVVPESGTIVSYATLQSALDRATGCLARLGLGAETTWRSSPPVVPP
jgi:hypothetical protein